MRLSLRSPTVGLAALLLVAPLLAPSGAHAQSEPAGNASAAAPPVDLPASESTAAAPADTDQVDLDDIRNFSRVYEVVRQARSKSTRLNSSH